MGVNCDGDSEVEGDVFWTMYPKYKLSYWVLTTEVPFSLSSPRD